MRGHANNFDGLRLIGALLVLFSHQFAVMGQWEPRFLGGHSFGNLGVLIFFSISGYLVSASWRSDPNLFRFLSRRFLRMAPGLAVCMPIVYGVVSWLGLMGFPDNPMHMLNGPLWTIPLEVYCYLILAGLALVLPRQALVFLLAMLVAWVTLRAAPRSTLAHFGLFFGMGMLLQEYPRLRGWKAARWFLLAGVALIPAHHYLALALIVPVLSILVGTRSWTGLRSGARFGDLSYGIYIYAWPVQQLGVALLGWETPYLTLLTITLLGTVSLAWLSWHFIEAPALKLKPTRLDDRASGHYRVV